MYALREVGPLQSTFCALASEPHAPGQSSSLNRRLPALQQEVRQEPPGRPGAELELTGHWTCLVDLLCGSDAWGVRLGQQWLHNLLVTAAETDLVHSHLPRQAGLALLPSLSPQVGRSRAVGVHVAITFFCTSSAMLAAPTTGTQIAS